MLAVSDMSAVREATAAVKAGAQPRVPTAVAAQMLGKSVATITRWCRAAEQARLTGGRCQCLPGAVQVGRGWQVPLTDIHHLLALTSSRKETAA